MQPCREITHSDERLLRCLRDGLPARGLGAAARCRRLAFIRRLCDRTEVPPTRRCHYARIQRDGELEDRTAQRSEPGWKLVGDLSGPSAQWAGTASQCVEPEPEGGRCAV